MNLDSYHTSHTKINSRWIIDLDVKGKILKHLESNKVTLAVETGTAPIFKYLNEMHLIYLIGSIQSSPFILAHLD